ncbi:MAG: hypothetical protein JWN94_4296 [Betaproteobacteria bacterium]|nr:hypothetical protein [Betaproteobacteria bacterium]
MHKLLIASIAAASGLAALSGMAHAEIFSATRPVIAILGSQIHVGMAEGRLNGAGSVAIHSLDNPNVKCVGEFTSSSKQGGSGDLRCTDGATATFKFERLTVFSGHGAGDSSRGSMSFTYGLNADEAARYLKLPPGKTLKGDGDEIRLADLDR